MRISIIALLTLVGALSAPTSKAEAGFAKVGSCNIFSRVNPKSKTYADIFVDLENPKGFLIVGSKKDGNYALVRMSFEVSDNYSTLIITTPNKFRFSIAKGNNIPVKILDGESFITEGTTCTTEWGD